MYGVSVKMEFSAAHRLYNHPGACQHLHGHNWVVDVSFETETLDAQGMVIDFHLVYKGLDVVKEKLDHKLINEVPPFDTLNPTAENLAQWIFNELTFALPLAPSQVTIYETGNTVGWFRP